MVGVVGERDGRRVGGATIADAGADAKVVTLEGREEPIFVLEACCFTCA